jgi:P27 family predicted phage terminase small subunit
MGKRGPKPQPNDLRVFRGNPGKRPLNPNEPDVPECETIEPPDWLSELAKSIWRELAQDLAACGILRQTDLNQFAVYCDSLATFREAQGMLAREGLLITDEKGNVRRHPAEMIKSSAFARIKSLAVEFRLTPGSRANNGVSPAGSGGGDADDPIEEALA